MLALYRGAHGQSAKVQAWAYGVIALLGTAYGVFEQQEGISWLTHSMKQMFPFLLLLMLALVVYGLFRAASSVRELLNGASLAALGTLQTNLRLRRGNP